MTVLEELDINIQLIYKNFLYSNHLALELLSFGHKHFREMERLKKISVLKELCYEFKNNPNSIPDSKKSIEIGFHSLIDSIRLTICFENYFKSYLLVRGYLVHRLNRDKHKQLRIKQEKEPIKLSEHKEDLNWFYNEKLKTENDELKHQLDGISKNTIGMKELLKPKYLEALEMDLELLKLCKPFFSYRDNVHLHFKEVLEIGGEDFNDFVKIIKFVNKNVVGLQHNLIDGLKIKQSKKMPKLDISAF